MNRLNELRVKAEHPQMRHDNVLQAVRKAREKLGPQIDALNFQDVDYVDAKGQKRPLIRLYMRRLIGPVAVLPRFLMRRHLGGVLLAARFSIAVLR